jgi:hypothetical protein
MKMCHSSGLECKYFVLNPKSRKARDAYAEASRQAMGTYAEVIATENPKLSNDLLHWVENETRNEYELRRIERQYRTESENPQWIEKLVFVDSGKFDHKWLRVIKCSADFVNETLSFFRRINPETKYRIAPE